MGTEISHDKALEDSQALWDEALRTRRQMGAMFGHEERMIATIQAIGEIREELKQLREENERLKRNQLALGSETPERK